jgi:hypothetical protein
MKLTAYAETIKQLKSAILASRYKAAALANRELLSLYFNTGKLITVRAKQGKWGDKILEQLSADLQHELPGLKGFSATNIKRMRLFYQQWDAFFSISPTVSDQLQKKNKRNVIQGKLIIGQLPSEQLSPTVSDQFSQYFFSVSFSHHYELLVKTKK